MVMIANLFKTLGDENKFRIIYSIKIYFSWYLPSDRRTINMKFLTKELIGYFGWTFLFTWSFWLVPLLKSYGIIGISISNDVFRIIGTFGPSIVGFIYLVKREKQRTEEVLRSILWIKASMKWISYMFFVMPFFLVISYLLARFLFQSTYELPFLTQPLLIPIAFFYILFTGGPLGEEIGWRGYALNKLLAIQTPFASSIIIGVLWAIWHIPLFLIKGTVQQQINFGFYIAYTIILSLLMTILHIKTKGSIFAAIVFHTTANLALGLFPIFTDRAGMLSIALILLIGITAILFLNRDLLFKKTKLQMNP